MKINHSYPYPVLSTNNDDYIHSNFSVQIEINNSFGELKINASFELKNTEILQLIHNKLCAYALHIECPITSFRKIYKDFHPKLEYSIPYNLLRGKVFIHSFIVAVEKMENYSNIELNEWYSSIPITFEKGNLVAIGKALEMTLLEDETEILDLPSIITITKSLKNEFMEVDIYSNNITISLPKYEYEQYALNAKSRLKNTIMSEVVVPALVYVFSKIKENKDDLKEFIWYQVMENIFLENNFNLDDVGSDSLSSLKAAQLVLRKPLKTSFEEIEMLNETEE